MYLNYWNLREFPFQNVADYRFAYLSEQHHEGLARLVYIAQNRKLGAVLTGPYGVGKSMVLELLSQQLRKDHATRLINLDYLPDNPVGFARQMLMAMGFRDAVSSMTEITDAISILRQQQQGLTHTTLTIDEAQAITDVRLYDFFRLLSNISLLDRQGRPTDPAFTIILAGYSDMAKLLTRDQSFCQRLQMIWALDPLNGKQILEYVQHRIHVAGGDIWLFESGAIEELGVTRGIPRLINNVCDSALMLGFAAKARQIDRTIMRQALSDASLNLFAKTDSAPDVPA